MSILSRFPSRIRIANPDGTATPEFLRMLDILVSRAGDAFGDLGAEVFAAVMPEQTAQPDIVQPLPAAGGAGDMLLQPLPADAALPEMVQQQADYSAGTALALKDFRFSLKDTAVTPGTYGDSTHVAQFTVDQQGRITAAANVPIDYPSGANYSGSFTGKTVTVTNGIITSVV